MNDELQTILYNKGADIVRFVDISGLPEQQTLGFNKAIIFCMALSKKFVLNMYNNLPVENDEFIEKEQKVEELADWLSEYIKKKGYDAHSQSERSNAKKGYIEKKYINPDLEQGISILPQKTIARLAGIGFIGKNNLLVTEEYGCAFSMCSVLTNAPISKESASLVSPKCGNCDVCVQICPGKAILGNQWTEIGGRESLIDVSKCFCALKCMMACPWTLKYARRKV